MKKALLVLFYSLLSVMLYGQGFAVSADRVNVAYEGVDNPLTIVLEHCNCDKLVVTTDNGQIRKDDRKCGYILSRAKPGYANFSVQKKEGSNLTEVGIVRYRVKEFPLPSVHFGGRQNGTMQMQSFKVQIGIANAYVVCAEAGTYPILSFTVEVLRKGQLIFNHDNQGNIFNVEVKRFFADKLIAGDRVFIKNIRCELAGRNRFLESFYVDLTP